MNPNWISTKNKKYFRFKCKHCGMWKNCPAETKKKHFIEGFCRGSCAGLYRRSDFYQTEDWRRLRYQALKKQGGKCQACGAGEKLHVDHIKPRSKFPEMALELGNLQVLCEDCNLGKGAWDQTDWRPTDSP